MPQNRIFAFIFSCETNRTLKLVYNDDSLLWNMRYGNINIRALKLLHNMKMVMDFPPIYCVDEACEGFILFTQHRGSFPARKYWRENKTLELVHEDICGLMHHVTQENKLFNYLCGLF